MQPKDIQDRIRALRTDIGPRANVYLALNEGGHPVRVSVYPHGITKGLAFLVEGDEFAETLAGAEAKWAEFRAEHRARTIRDMALAIIRITAERGACSDAALRDADFLPADIQHLGAEACAEADAMAANGPFSIVAIAGANAA